MPIAGIHYTQHPFYFFTYCPVCHFAPDETVVTLIKTGSSGAFSLFAVYSTIMLPLRGNCSGDLLLRTAYPGKTEIFDFIFFTPLAQSFPSGRSWGFQQAGKFEDLRNGFKITDFDHFGTDYCILIPATAIATYFSILNKHNDEPPARPPAWPSHSGRKLRLTNPFLLLSLHSFKDPAPPSHTTAGRQVF